MISHQGYLSIRRDPVNVISSEAHLFEAAKQVQIPDTNLVHLTNVSVLKNHLFLLSKFSFLNNLAHILPVSNLSQFKKLSLFLLPAKKIKEGIWITDEWSGEYFHWLTDALPRWIVAGSERKNLPVILPFEYRSIGFVGELLQLLGLEAIFYNKSKRLLVKNMWVASHTAPTGNYNRQILELLRSRFDLKIAAVPSKKVYVSRSMASKRKVLNENDLIRLLTRHDFEIHHFEKYTITATMELMANTKCLMGLHGAGLTNMLFMPTGGSLIELRATGDTHNNAFYALASDVDLSYYYLQCQPEGNDLHVSDVKVDLDLLNTLLSKIK